mgnify:FL=1
MDTSMILGLPLAGSIVLLSGNKHQTKKTPDPKPNTEFVVRVSGGDVAVSPKQ